MPRNPKWSREELILALDLYFRCNPRHTSKEDPAVIEFSHILNKMTHYYDKPDEERFRNPNGVYMKLCNFLRFDPSYPGVGLQAGGKLEEDIWREFSNNKEYLSKVAASIKSKL